MLTDQRVDYIDHMGDDLTVVNAARVSFNKRKSEFDDKDEKLIKYLAEHNHFTPFTHCTLTVKIKCPIFVARQLLKHQIGLSVNEVSRRYVDDPPEFMEINEWRQRAENKKQGSGDYLPKILNTAVNNEYKRLMKSLEIAYNSFLKAGVAPEQARAILPQSMMTEFYWTGSLFAFTRICNLRLDPHAQIETGDIARMILKILKEKFPVSVKYLVKNS